MAGIASTGSASTSSLLDYLTRHHKKSAGSQGANATQCATSSATADSDGDGDGSGISISNFAQPSPGSQSADSIGSLFDQLA